MENTTPSLDTTDTQAQPDVDTGLTSALADSADSTEVLLTDEDQEAEVLLTDCADFPALSTADATGDDVNNKLLGITVDPQLDVTAELAALSDADKERMQSLREMAEAEHMTLTDAQLLAFLKKFKNLHEATKAFAPKKRDVNEKAKAKRRAAAKAAKAARKRNRR